MTKEAEKIIQWLESHINDNIRIRKQEDGDLDEVSLKLENVVQAVRNETHPDDYVAAHSLILHGEGKVLTNGEEVVLPKNIYEMPYDVTITGVDEGDSFSIETDRASYRLQVEG